MNTRHFHLRFGGFTLVEMLLALAIFGVIAALSYRAIATLTDGEAQLSSAAHRWRTLDALFTRFEADIRQAVPRASRTASGVEPPWLALPTGRADSAALVFTRAGAEFADEPGRAGQRVGYRLRGHVLEIAYWPQLDNVAGVQPAVYSLIDGVSGFRIDYLNKAGQWRDRWPLQGEADLPRAVRVQLAMDGGEVIERWFVLR